MENEDKYNYIEIMWTDRPVEKIIADSIGAYDGNPKFLIAFKDGNDVPVGFYNSDFIVSIKVICND